MRVFTLIVILLSFAAQSLALAAAPACDHDGMGSQAVSASEHSMHGHMAQHQGMDHHGAVGETAGAHQDMPCCQDTAGASADTLCQLTCSAGGCSAAALPASQWQLSPVPTTYLFVPLSPSPLAASARNLLRPPIGA